MTASKTLLPDATHSQRTTWQSCHHGLTLALIVAVAAVLSLHALGAKSLWFDEGFGVGLARLPWRVFTHVLWWREGNMALYYLLLRGWLHFGQSEAWIRGLSLVFAIAAIPALYFLGRRLFDARTGLIAAALLAVNAFHVEYAQEARSYSLLVFLCVLSSLFFVNALEAPSKRDRRLYIAASALAVYAHFFALLLIAAQWLSLRFLRDSRLQESAAQLRQKKNWLWLMALVSPVVIFILKTGAGPLRWLTRPTFLDLWSFALQMTGSGGAALFVLYAIAIAAAVIPTFLLLKSKLDWKPWRAWFLFLWAFFPPCLIWLASFARPLFYPRYFIFCVPALALLAAAGIRRIRPAAWLGIAFVVFLFLGLRGTLAYYHSQPVRETQSWRASANYVMEHAQPGDALLFWIPTGRLPFEYYAGRRSAAPAILYPGPGPMTFRDFSAKPDYRDIPQELVQHPRVWLVLSNAWDARGVAPPAASLTHFLNANYTTVQTLDFGDLHTGDPQIRLYSKP